MLTMKNELFLDAVAVCTAREIVNRHAPDCADREALIAAIARVQRRGLDAALRLYQTQQASPSGDS
jgi:hypothetical protein